MDPQQKALKDKVTDYKRFGFILVALSMFLFIGLLVPAQGLALHHPELFIAAVFLTLGLAAFFHRIAMKAEKQLQEDQQS